MSLQDKITARKSAKVQETQQQHINPQIDAALTAHMARNQAYVDKLRSLEKETLVRRLMLQHMNKHSYVEANNQKILEWVERNPEVKNRIQQKLQSIAPENQMRATISLAKKEQQHIAMNMSKMG